MGKSLSFLVVVAGLILSAPPLHSREFPFVGSDAYYALLRNIYARLERFAAVLAPTKTTFLADGGGDGAGSGGDGTGSTGGSTGEGTSSTGGDSTGSTGGDNQAALPAITLALPLMLLPFLQRPLMPLPRRQPPMRRQLMPLLLRCYYRSG